MKKGLWYLVIFVIMLQPLVVAQNELSNDQEKRIQRLEQIIQTQQERIDSLQQKLEQPAPVVKTTTTASNTGTDYTTGVVEEYMKSPDAADEGAEFGYESRGFYIRSSDLEVYFKGFNQMGIAFFENDSFDNNNIYPNGVSVSFDVYMFKDWHGRIELNFMALVPSANGFQTSVNAEGTQVWDAYVEYLGVKDEMGNPLLALRAGQTHVPFSLEGQWNPNQGISIWGEPFSGWSHGRDPGLMAWGVLSDMVEYKLSVHNGEGQSTTNATDDFLMGGSIRIYPFKKSVNADSFFHVGAIRSRDDTVSTRASLTTPWGRPVFDTRTVADTTGNGIADSGTDAVQGWRTGADAGFSMMVDLGDDGVNSIYVEGELMYITWERNFDSGRLPFLVGYGGFFGLSFKHNMTPEVPGAGLFVMGKFSYTDIDNKDTDDLVTNADIKGQNVKVYTAGVGYSFNAHVTAQLNWVVVDLSEKDLYNTTTNAAKNEPLDGSDDLEHGWFFQVTAQW